LGFFGIFIELRDYRKVIKSDLILNKILIL